jgi:hypothetical protein
MFAGARSPEVARWVGGGHARGTPRATRALPQHGGVRHDRTALAGSPPEPPGGVAFAGAARTSQRRAGDRKRRQKRARGGRTAGPTDPPDS